MSQSWPTPRRNPFVAQRTGVYYVAVLAFVAAVAVSGVLLIRRRKG